MPLIPLLSLPLSTRALTSFALLTLLAACGGGGSGDGGSTPPITVPAFTVGGTLTGLIAPAQLTITLNGGAGLLLSTAGSFKFANALPSGTNYAVTITAQPAGQNCMITNGSGVLAGEVANVTITCASTPPPVVMATIGGTIAGMNSGTTLTLVNNGVAPVTYGGSGAFSFSSTQGDAYELSVARNPSGQWCQVIGGAGIATAATTPVTVTCQSAQLVQLAGSGGGAGSADGIGTNSRFNRPMGMVVDSAGNLFVADRDNLVIRKISPAGVVTTFAGSAGQLAHVDATGTAARFGMPIGLAIDSSDNLYVTDGWFSNVRKISSAGVVTTVVSKAAMLGVPDAAPGPGQNVITGIVRDSDGTLYIADSGARVIRKRMPDGTVSILAGQEGPCGHADGAGSVATFCIPTAMALDAGGNLVVIDAGNQLVRKISPGGIVSTLAGIAGEVGGRDGPGSTALFGFGSYYNDSNLPLAGIIAEPSGSVLVTDYHNGRVRRIAADGTVTTAAGLGEGYIDGPAASARFRKPTGLAQGADGTIFVAEDTHAIRKIAAGQVSTFAGKPIIGDLLDGTGSAAYFNGIYALAADAAGNVYVADHNNNAVRKVTPAGVVSTIAGRMPGTGPGEVTAALDRLNNPSSIAVDRAGNLYVTDRSCVRKIDKNGTITTLAGSPVESGSADGAGSVARFRILRGITVDDNGNVYVADSYSLRKITADGTVSTLVTSPCDYRDGPAGWFCNVMSLAVDRAGTLYFSDYNNGNIRKLSTDGIMSTLAGNTIAHSSALGSADGQGAAAKFSGPGSIGLDSKGNLYVLDAGNNTVRMITPGGSVSTVVGTVGRPEVHEGPLPGMIAGGTLTIGHDDQLYISSANGVLTVKVR